MRVTRLTFEEVAIKATRRWIDPATGRKRQETMKFSQTLNPFNKTPDGRVKSRAQILEEIKAQRDAWLAGSARGEHG